MPYRGRAGRGGGKGGREGEVAKEKGMGTGEGGRENGKGRRRKGQGAGSDPSRDQLGIVLFTGMRREGGGNERGGGSGPLPGRFAWWGRAPGTCV